MAPKYTQAALDSAVHEILDGASATAVAETSNIPVTTIRKWVRNAKNGVAQKRRGSKPLLPVETEDAIQDWVIGRQIVRHPVGRGDILRKSREISELVAGRAVTDGWYTRFMARHTDLANRSAQTLSKARNAVDFEDIRLLFSSMAKVIIETGATADRIFNIDETAFYKAAKSKRVVDVRRSKNVWTTTPTASFHMTIIACGSAAGFVVPLVFIFPGKTVRLDVLQGCDVPGAGVSATESGFLGMALFAEWLTFFAASVPASTKRALILVMDGCCAHYSRSVVALACRLGIVMVCLPPNATHLIQPLDVAVFASLKGKLRVLVNEFVVEASDGGYSIDKTTAVKLSCMAWNRCHFATNIAYGFEAAGLFPLSLVNMQYRMDLYTRNGTPVIFALRAWLQSEMTVRRHMLTLPAPPKKTNKRKTAPVGGKILTAELMEEMEAQQSKKKGKRKQVADIVEGALV